MSPIRTPQEYACVLLDLSAGRARADLYRQQVLAEGESPDAVEALMAPVVSYLDDLAQDIRLYEEDHFHLSENSR